MDLYSVTPLILTYNERPNIERTLRRLAWARQIVVVDSGSTDGTLEVLARHPAVRIAHRAFDDFASQCNYGLEQIGTPWTLSIDADYICPPELEGELRALPDDANGFECAFVYCIYGRRLRACLYPPRVVLFRTDRGRYVADGHAHRLRLEGKCIRLKTSILHDDRKPLARWLAEQSKYAELEVAKLLATPRRRLGWKDKLRTKILWAPVLTLFYCLIGKGLMLDGWPGIYYSLQRAYAELLLSLKLLDARLSGAWSRERGARSVENGRVEEREGPHPALSQRERDLDGAQPAVSQSPHPALSQGEREI